MTEQAAETARRTFEEGQAAESLPTVKVKPDELASGIGLLSLIVQCGLANSNGEARRHVKGGAIRLNDKAIADERLAVTSEWLNDDGAIKLSLGKKKHFLVRPD